MADFATLAEQFKKDYGEKTVQMGGTVCEVSRIPTGIFPLDLATGGGVPRGRVTELFGPESSCKSNIALLLVAAEQALNPDKKNAWIDVEHSFDPVWAKRLGVDVDSLWVLNPDYSEHVVNMAEGLMSSPECGLVVLDSLAAMVTEAEGEGDAEKSNPGGSGMASKKLFNKIMLAQRRAEEHGLNPTFVFINQIRHKIGVLFGSPETQPGGFTPKHAASLRLRFYAKNVKDDKVSTVIAPRKQITVQVVKHKVPIAATLCEFEMAVIPHEDLAVGQVDNWKTLYPLMLREELVTKQEGKGLVLNGELFKTQKALKSYVEADKDLCHLLKVTVIQAEISRVYAGLEIKP
jgi:recombination protein RecA